MAGAHKAGPLLRPRLPKEFQEVDATLQQGGTSGAGVLEVCAPAAGGKDDYNLQKFYSLSGGHLIKSVLQVNNALKLMCYADYITVCELLI